MWLSDVAHRHLLRCRRRQWHPALYVIVLLPQDNKPLSAMDVGSGAIEHASRVSVNYFYFY